MCYSNVQALKNAQRHYSGLTAAQNLIILNILVKILFMVHSVRKEIDICVIKYSRNKAQYQLTQNSDPICHGLAESCKIMLFYSVVMVLLISSFATRYVLYIHICIYLEFSSCSYLLSESVFFTVNGLKLNAV
jgi:hypothetical protein